MAVAKEILDVGVLATLEGLILNREVGSSQAVEKSSTSNASGSRGAVVRRRFLVKLMRLALAEAVPVDFLWPGGTLLLGASLGGTAVGLNTCGVLAEWLAEASAVGVVRIGTKGSEDMLG